MIAKHDLERCFAVPAPAAWVPASYPGDLGDCSPSFGRASSSLPLAFRDVKPDDESDNEENTEMTRNWICDLQLGETRETRVTTASTTRLSNPSVIGTTDAEGDPEDGTPMCATLTDKSVGDMDDAFRVRDSDFGLSEWQFEELMERFSASANANRYRLLSEDSQNSNSFEQPDSEYGLADHQLEEVVSRHSQDPVAADKMVQLFRPSGISHATTDEADEDVLDLHAKNSISDRHILPNPGRRYSQERAGKSSRGGPPVESGSSAIVAVEQPDRMDASSDELAPIRNTTSPHAVNAKIGGPGMDRHQEPIMPRAAAPVHDGTPRRLSHELDTLDSFLSANTAARRSYGNIEKSLDQTAPPLDPRWRALILSVRVVSGCIWYLIKVFDGGEARFLMKSFTDFQDVDAGLRLPGLCRRVNAWGAPPPELPVQGIVGLGRRLTDFLGGHNGFQAERRRCLQSYLDALSAWCPILRNHSVLIGFVGNDARGRIFPRDQSGSTFGCA